MSCYQCTETAKIVADAEAAGSNPVGRTSPPGTIRSGSGFSAYGRDTSEQMIGMPRFYFHARGPSRLVPDKIGEELPDIQGAHAIALQVIQDILSDPLDGTCYEALVIEIVDESDQTVLIVPFRPAFPPLTTS